MDSLRKNTVRNGDFPRIIRWLPQTTPKNVPHSQKRSAWDDVRRHNKSGNHLLRRNRRHAGFLLSGIWHDIVDINFASHLDTSMFNACMFPITNTTNRPDLLGPDYSNGTFRRAYQSSSSYACSWTGRCMATISPRKFSDGKKHAVRLAKGQFIRP